MANRSPGRACFFVRQAAAESDNPYPESKNIFPARYASPLTSPLRADVSPAGNNVFRFKLEP